MIEGQEDVSWEDWQALGATCERLGFEAQVRSDHYASVDGARERGALDAWGTICGLAAVTETVRLGTLVSPATFRHPSVLAKTVLTADHISGGRVELGLGTGWHEREHRAYGFPFPSLRTRMDRLAEQLEIVSRSWEEGAFSFAGEHWSVEALAARPKPVQRPLPLLVGGGGEKVTMRIAARYADEWNVWGSPDTLRHKMAILDRHCADAGRDPQSIKRSAQALLFLSDDPAVMERARAAAPRPVIAGTVDDVRRIVGDYAAAGVDELIIPDFTLGRGEQKKRTMDRFINEVAAAFR